MFQAGRESLDNLFEWSGATVQALTLSSCFKTTVVNLSSVSIWRIEPYLRICPVHGCLQGILLRNGA